VNSGVPKVGVTRWGN